ncbi:Putative membrane-bound ClpP-class protease [Pseudomonas sp. XWY-1]|uniref:NfeD family protein n=1 Tax=Pseudomonas TaxID=286 RepID=UPI000CDC4ECD|nr:MULTISPECIES: nodulation protein NfeD [Pseudomonas]QNV65214.1 nodulation protein NfeD [Pseudomonas sp. CFA]AUZ56819.1 Putative membrane-bound ClpP-class protease [Pseudomonas sp. XWY-1]MCX2813229.1 nodulation protein NfeD [Pseudomonas sp. DCB_E]MCX9141221.1 nodulation protein NfeD [Pseudomonas sp. DCB_Q]MDD2006181.1 nodulation protein NfeD [Pseudomonas putida]
MIARCWRWLLLLLLLGITPGGQAAPGAVWVLNIDDAIGPASADYLVRSLSQAQAQGAQLVVIRMDTPGGLDSAMRQMIKAILASPVPVASYVAPSGARAASAGTYILYASHVAAMAPGTNLGAATPVRIGGAPGTPSDDKAKSGDDETLARKQVNDAAAYIRGLAQLRGRNADWAEKAVREAVSLSASEALRLNVIDQVADDLPDLLRKLDGKTLQVAGQPRQLQTAGASVVEHLPDWRTRFLAVITNPSVALILIMIGVYGLLFEFMNPGSAVGGVVGGICLLLALYALQLLPVSFAGVALILLGITFMIAEAFLPSFGVVGFGGIVAFVVGALILIDTDAPGFGIPLALIGTLALLSALLIGGVLGMALKARQRALVSGDAGLVGSLVTVTQVMASDPFCGVVLAQGEPWQARCATPLQTGQNVRVTARHGVMLEVSAAAPATQGE